MRKVLVPAVLAAALLHPAMALAQDAPPVAASTADSEASADDMSGGGTRFRGIRIEGDVGWDRFSAESQTPSKLGYGGTVGFDGQYKRFVLGAEGSYWTADGGHGNGFCITIQNGDVNCRHAYHEWGAALRAGYLVTPKLLVFAKGGWVQGKEDTYVAHPAGHAGGYIMNPQGYQVGGGIEYSLPMRGLPFYVTAQYVRSQYDNYTSRQRVFGGVGLRFR